MPTILVTGAGGFIGSNLCPVLEAAGLEVRRATRRDMPGAAHVSDIGPATDWSAALKGVDAVAHLAARVHVLRAHREEPIERFRQVNVEATRNLAEQAARAGVRRFIFMSTIGVHGVKTSGRGFCEGDAPNPVNHYALSKYQAATAVREIAEKSGMEYVFLRPPLVYGPGVKANFLKLLRVVDRALPLPLASIRNRRDMLYVGNLANVVLRCIADPRAANRIFLVADGEPVATPDLIRGLARHMRRPCRLFPCPPRFLKALGKITGQEENILRLTGSLEVDISLLKRTLDWTPPFTLDEGLEATTRWYLEGRSA